jgi:hypothetical protein
MGDGAGYECRSEGVFSDTTKAAVRGVSGVLGSLRDNRKGLRSAKAFDKGFKVTKKSKLLLI